MKIYLSLFLCLFMPAIVSGQGVEASRVRKTTFANLGTPADSNVRYCTDCNVNVTPCTGGGTGAMATRVNGAWSCATGDGGTGDVVGPGSATDNAAARFDGTGGKTLQNSLMTIDDSGSVNIPAGQTYKINGTSLAKGDVGLGNVDNTSDATKNSATATLTGKTITAPILTRYTVATLPAGGTAGKTVYVSDGLTATDCTVGGGSVQVLCAYNGSAYAHPGVIAASDLSNGASGTGAVLLASSGSATGLTADNTSQLADFDVAALPGTCTSGKRFHRTGDDTFWSCLAAGNTYSQYWLANINTIVAERNTNGVDAGSNDTYVVTLSPSPAAYVVGDHLRFFANTVNTGAASINVNGLGALTLVKIAGGITTTLANGDIPAGAWIDCTIAAGSNCQVTSGLGNAASGGITNGAGANVVPKSDGTNLVTSPLTMPSVALINTGATTAGPDFEVAITGDTSSRIALGVNVVDGARLSMGPGNAVRDLFLERRGAANLQFGAPDAAAPVAQTSSVQNVVAGTTDTVGANRTYDGSQGTGTGAGGSHIFRVAPAGSTASTQNALTEFLRLDSTRLATFTKTAIGATATDSILLTNTTAAAVGAQQFSPSFEQCGNGWKTTATAASQQVCWRMEVTPLQSTTNPGSVLNFSDNANGGAYTSRLSLFRDLSTAGAGPINIYDGTTTGALQMVAIGAGSAFDVNPNNSGNVISRVRGGGSTLFIVTDPSNTASNDAIGFGAALAESATGPFARFKTILAARPSLAVDGTASQTADIFQVRDNSGALQFQVTAAGLLVNPTITADTAHTDTAVCQDTTTHGFYSGTGTLGVCLGTSRLRAKQNIAALSAGLTEVMRLRPISFNYKRGLGYNSAKTYYGFGAEDVAPVLPELVPTDSEGKPHSVDMLGMFPVMVKAMQEMQGEIVSLKAQIKLLKQRRARHRQ